MIPLNEVYMSVYIQHIRWWVIAVWPLLYCTCCCELLSHLAKVKAQNAVYVCAKVTSICPKRDSVSVDGSCCVTWFDRHLLMLFRWIWEGWPSWRWSGLRDDTPGTLGTSSLELTASTTAGTACCGSPGGTGWETRWATQIFHWGG